MKSTPIQQIAAALSSLSLCIGTPIAVASPTLGHEVQDEARGSGLHDFDFFVGSWHVHHRQLKARLVNSHEWIEFRGTTVAQALLGGAGNLDDNIIDKPNDAYRAVTLRSYDAQSRQWSIWWLDGRHPLGPLEPPVRGSFKNGIGTFYADDSLDGKPIRVRFTWTHASDRTCHWEQAFSPDDGEHWETNWVMDFERV